MDTKAALRIARIAFPDWKGRKIKVEEVSHVRLSDRYWDGGTRSEYRAVELDTLHCASPQVTGFNAPAEYGGLREDPTIEIPEGVAIVEHSIFCGKDIGCRVYLRAAPALPVSDSEYYAKLTQ
jgi:hypothetical protein